MFRGLLARSDNAAWRWAAALMCGALWTAASTGCTKESPAPRLAAAPVSSAATLPIRPAGNGPELVHVLEDDPELAHVRVQTRDGRSFYTHRSFVKLTKEGHILLSAGELLNKPAGEEYYFTLQEIGDIRDKIPGLYMTPSGRRLVAPWKTPQFLHQGEWAWPVYECLKADCPGRDPTALHGALFILPDPKLTGDVDFRVLEAQRDHQVNTTPGRSAEDEFATAEYVCSHCRQAGRPGSEEAARQQFRRYRLPESETMWRELDDEYQRSRQVRVRKFNRGNPSLAESP